jgi:hypothetical protein
MLPYTIQQRWPPPCVCNNQHRNHRFFHGIRIRSTQVRISGNFQRVLRRFRWYPSRNQSFHAFWITPPREMPPKPRQPRAPRPKQSGNAFQALVDLPEDGSTSTFDGRDGKVDESDGFSAGNTLQRAPSAASEAPRPPPRYTTDYGDSLVRKWRKELVNEAVSTYIFGAEIDCSAENILQYYAANTTMGAHLE